MTTIPRVSALVFDVFGTTVDWCSGVAREAEALLAPKGHALDWTAFANSYRSGYQPAMAPVREGKRPYVTMDVLHREMLEPALAEYGVTSLSTAEKDGFALVWRRLDPWPDVVEGLTMLKQHRIIAALSNANIALATHIAKRAKLPWDVILGSELVQTYKPMPAVYDSAPRLLDLPASEVMMVACHLGDLRAAARRGLRTAYVRRPDEYGPGKTPDPPQHGEFDIVCNSFIDLAQVLD
jgi:2-haloacid dehalogenase